MISKKQGYVKINIIFAKKKGMSAVKLLIP